MGRHQRDADRWLLAVVGALVLLVAAAGLVHAVRAAGAGWLYRASEFAATPQPPEVRLELCRRAYDLYPWNYYYSIRAAELSYRQYETAATNADTWLAKATWWCERGLAQNRYKSQLIRLQTRLLWPDSPAAAIACWEQYTDWHYWAPYNHAVLAEFYAKAGQFDKAERELALIKAFPDHGDAAKAVAAERATWDRLLREGDEEWGE